MINATNSGSKPKELIPSGNYVARCYSMIHIGTVEEEIMGEKKIVNKVRITWELPEELRIFNEKNGEQPLVISKEYTLSMHEKANLRRDLESWRGKQFSEENAKNFDITKLLGVPCMLNIIHKFTKTNAEYAAISNISTLPKNLRCPDQINETFEWNYDDKYDEEALESFPDFIKDKIKKSAEYNKKITSVVDLTDEMDNGHKDDDNDLPF